MDLKDMHREPDARRMDQVQFRDHLQRLSSVQDLACEGQVGICPLGLSLDSAKLAASTVEFTKMGQPYPI